MERRQESEIPSSKIVRERGLCEGYHMGVIWLNYMVAVSILKLRICFLMAIVY